MSLHKKHLEVVSIHHMADSTAFLELLEKELHGPKPDSVIDANVPPDTVHLGQDMAFAIGRGIHALQSSIPGVMTPPVQPTHGDHNLILTKEENDELRPYVGMILMLTVAVEE